MGWLSRSSLLLAALLPALALGARAQDDGSRPARTGDDSPPDLEAFEQTWRTIRDQFWDRNYNGADWEGLRARFLPRAKEARTRRELHEVTLAMLAGLRSSHTTIIEPDVYREHLDNEAKGTLAPTIGIELVKLDRGYFVADVIAGSPAEAAGVLRGDRLLHVEGSAPDDAGLRPAPWDVGLGGPRGFYLPSGGRPLLLELERRPESSQPGYNVYVVRIAPRPWNHIEGVRASARTKLAGPDLRLGYVRLYHLLSEDVVDVLADLLLSKPLVEADGLVLDLRGRGGLPAAVDRVIELFDRRAKQGPVFGRPVVAVVDGETRSAKEILAWSWKSLGLGPIVGERTRGAVIGARFVPLPDGAWLLLANTDMRCFTAGSLLEGKGVEPDVLAKDDLPYAAGRDPLVEKAEEVLLERVLRARRSGRHGWY